MFIKDLWNGLFCKKDRSISAVTDKPNVPMEEDVPEVNHAHDISAATEEPDNSTIQFSSFEEAKPYLIQQLKKISEKKRDQPDNFSEIRKDLTNHVADMIQTTTRLKSTKYPNGILDQYDKELVEFVEEVYEYTGFCIVKVYGDDGLLKLGFILGKEAFGVYWEN